MSVDCTRFVAGIMSRNAWMALRLLLVALLTTWSPLALVCSAADYVRDIRPILSANCFACHGPDELTREADLRLDESEDALADRGGYAAIVPGSPDLSEALLRILDPDPDMRMPPGDSGKSLTDEQVETLRDWILEGAEYQPHWSFEPVVRPELPSGEAEHPIDRFIDQRLAAEKLEPAGPADSYTLIRRVYLDLIGLPPTPEEADAFASDPSERAYLALVDRLLASPRYGERWARLWLDLARYSDTKGYEKDRPRTMWPYRDWVINAINRDLPFDQFTIEQIAGDMLPGATRDQRIATGFHRNTMTNEEGGIDPQEFRFLSVVDRVSTTGATWLGLTLGCAQCHTHKYDPTTHQDYFAFFALLNNADEVECEIPTDEHAEKLIDWRGQVTSHEAALAGRLRELLAGEGDDADEAIRAAVAEWAEKHRTKLVAWTIQTPIQVDTNLPLAEVLEDDSVLISGDVTNTDRYTVLINPPSRTVSAVRIEALPHQSLPRGASGRRTIGDNNAGSGVGSFLLTEAIVEVVGEDDTRRVDLVHASASYTVPETEASLAIDGRHDTGWTVAGRQLDRQTLVVRPEESIILQDGERLRVTLRHDSFYPAGLGRFRIATTDSDRTAEATGLSDEVISLLLEEEQSTDTAARQMLMEAFLLDTPLLAEEQVELAELRNRPPQVVRSPVMRQRLSEQRVTKRRHRGEYLKEREVVEPATPAFLPPMEQGAQADRLSLAQWLVSRQNPLTARVVVNREWQAFFGRGLVKTVADFGMQGEYPTHPELLDWLAAEFMEEGWSRKRLHRLIVTSNAYRRSSSGEASWARDPENLLLARAPRIRLDAELARDLVLSVSGLLSGKIGGPSVFPPQPPGITEAAYGPLEWVVSEGEDRYRRGLYTFNKRTAPYAAFGLFDAPSGEICKPRRNRSNTPLQALAMLNDEVINEASRALAQRVLEQSTDDQRVAALLLRSVLTRPPSEIEVSALSRFAASQIERLEASELDPQGVLNSGEDHEWEFDSEDHDWIARNQARLAIDDGQLVVESTGEDPHIGVDVSGGVGSYQFSFEAHSDEAVAYELFWTTEKQPAESPERRVLLENKPDEWRKHTARFTTDSPLRSLRLDTGGAEGETRIRSAGLRFGDGLFDYASVEDPIRLAAWRLAARAVLNLDEVITRP